MHVALALVPVFYVISCMAVGLCARSSRFTLVGTALLAAFLTPPVMLLVLFLFDRRGAKPPAR